MDGSQAPEVVMHQGIEPYYRQDNKGGAFSDLRQEDGPQTPLEEPKKNNIMGLHRSTFWLLIILTVVVIAAAVGGGVGGSIAVSNSKNMNKAESSSPTATNVGEVSTVTECPAATSSSGYFIVPENAVVPPECPRNGATKIVTMYDVEYTFELTCDSDRNGADTFKVAAYTLSDCLAACGGLIAAWGRGACTGVAFRSDNTGYHTNCFMKNGTLPSTNRNRGITSAVLKKIGDVDVSS